MYGQASAGLAHGYSNLSATAPVYYGHPAGPTYGVGQFASNQGQFSRVTPPTASSLNAGNRENSAQQHVALVAQSSTVLQTADIFVQSSDGTSLPCSVLFDSGSNRSYVTTELVSRCGINSIGKEYIRVSGFGEKQSIAPKWKNIYSIALMAQDGSIHNLKAIETPTICEPISRSPIPQASLEAFNNVPIINAHHTASDVHVSLLIGIDH